MRRRVLKPGIASAARPNLPIQRLWTAARIGDHQLWAETQPPVPAQSANYIPSLDGFAFARTWYPGDAQAITWLNDHISGSPVVLEAAAPASYQWYNRVSVYTGLPDVLGWPDHVGEQRYGNQIGNREAPRRQLGREFFRDEKGFYDRRRIALEAAAEFEAHSTCPSFQQRN